MSEPTELYVNKDINESVTEVEEDEDAFLSHRVFMNHVDQYHALHIADYLTDRVVGTLLGGGEERGEGIEEEEKVSKVQVSTFGLKYEVIGTMRHKFGKQSEDISKIISENDKEEFKKEVMRCGYILYDISQDEAEIPKALETLKFIEEEIDKVKDVGPKTFKKFETSRTFILISNIMTWANTKPIDPDDPETAFTEADYRKRKPHPNYLQHIACEREVILKGRKYKDKLKTYVVCAGITYGFEEQDLFFLFKLAWSNETHLPVFLPGNNIVPLLHVHDLAVIVHYTMEILPKKPQYILAVEQTPCKLRQITKALSKAMGSNRIKDVSKEEAFLYNNMTQSIFDRYTVNLNMEPAVIVDDFGVEFRSDLNLAENMVKIVMEFRDSHNLRPIKVVMHGPPASGKSIIGRKIEEIYGLHFVSVKLMIEELLTDMKNRVDEEIEKKKAREEKGPVEEEEDDEEVEEEEEEYPIEDLLEKIKDIEITMAESENGKLPDDYVIRLLRSFLASNQCQNQGFVLDGFPKTIVQARELFGTEAGGGGEEAGEEEDDEEVSGGARVSILPTHVISLEANDAFLCNRVMQFPEKDVQETHYTEEHMMRRLKMFRANNTEDNTVLNFFDEIEIHPIILNAMDDENTEMSTTLQKTKLLLGSPVGFEASPEDKEQMMLCLEEAARLKEEEQRLEAELIERRAMEEYQFKMEERLRVLSDLQTEEEKILVAEAEPLRNYLMKYVFPTLTTGLLEIARVKPEDPVDYLAEYLFRANPEGKMFDPSYTRQGELLESFLNDAEKDK
ncbi:PREDICTED: adenylate kinase 7-like [Nicrophorus vespilloides]|uniref:Adenylate kinase 7-like n=1 Tax=Nicrophorus vespilloides TaxID=110193 RepID=A0ABM1N469_NICVS|nr:PREDICTED: adenylate kinase 7-like [Nicrophorus vespilloides]